MTVAVAIECKKLCMFRCFYAVGLSIGMQYLLLAVFLLFANFNIFHPIDWITNTFSLMFSFYTWLSIMPLISAVIVYGVLLGKSFLSVKRYYATRFAWICRTAFRKLLFLSIHLLVGFLTAWLYSTFLHENYRDLLFEYFDRPYVNSRFTFLLFTGVSAGFYYFLRENLKHDPEIEFPIIQEMKFVQIRSLLYSTLYNSMLKSFVPTICCAISYWLIGSWFNRKIGGIFGAESDDALFVTVTNFRTLFYAWILCSQILSNMQLMSKFFSIHLGEEMHFVIEKNPVMTATQNQVTLVEALSLTDVPIVQKMAALDLYSLSVSKPTNRRQEIFALSIPGGHAYNWNQLSSQCLSLIEEFTQELSSSVKGISTMKCPPLYTQLHPSTTESAEKILLRQYNETFGIRRMMPEPYIPPQQPVIPPAPPNACDRVNEALDNFQKMIEDALKSAFRAVPGLFYLFGEPDGAKTVFLLSNSQGIVWLVQGLAGICASSLHEDKYGVVQNQLPKIIKAFLKLKLELDKLNNVNLNGKKLDRNLSTLRNAVKRSLYRICTVFGDYMRDLIDDPDEFRHLQCFINYQDT